jgi:hypothetical protein
MEEKIQEVLKTLYGLKYKWNSSGSNYESDVIAKEGKIVVEQIIREFAHANRDNEIGILRAKVFMYEEIISKSNFSPLIASVKIEEEHESKP